MARKIMRLIPKTVGNRKWKIAQLEDMELVLHYVCYMPNASFRTHVHLLHLQPRRPHIGQEQVMSLIQMMTLSDV
eukprot:13404307-Ditylum_brightwellii.AAC.1